MKTQTAIIIGGISLASYFAIRGYRKQQGAMNLKIDIRDVAMPKFSGGIVLPLQVVAINPSVEDFVIQYPTVRAYFKDGSDIGVSIPKDEQLTIKRSSQSMFPMEIKTGVTDLLTLATGELFDAFKNKSFKGKTILMDVMTAWNGIPLQFTGFEKRF